MGWPRRGRELVPVPCWVPEAALAWSRGEESAELLAPNISLLRTRSGRVSGSVVLSSARGRVTVSGLPKVTLQLRASAGNSSKDSRCPESSPVPLGDQSRKVWDPGVYSNPKTGSCYPS